MHKGEASNRVTHFSSFDVFCTGCAAGASLALPGRRLRAKVIALAGTMSSAPSQVSVLDFFAPAGLVCASGAMNEAVANNSASGKASRDKSVFFMMELKQLFEFCARRDGFYNL